MAASTTSVQFGPYNGREEGDKGIEIIKGMFFDGTRNNKTNTEGRMEYNKTKKSTDPADVAKAQAYKDHGKGDETSSYQNTYSNVARIWEGYKNDGKIYIEGIGTTDSGADDTLGYALGTGETGVRSKVEKGCSLLVSKLPKGKVISKLTVDVFGFSRGAAAARHFVAEISKSEERKDGKVTPARGHFGALLAQAGLVVERLEIRYLGIFDTVSSYEPGASSMASWSALNHDFTNDVDELKLNNIQRAKCVLHLTAENEHRENFALTRTHVGVEKSLPGVHCDIGGSYTPGVESVDEILNGPTDKLTKERDRLVAEGWYKTEQLTIHNFRRKLSGQRTLKNTFSYIPLHLMVEYGLKFDSTIPINKALLETQKYVISNDPLLVRAKTKLKAFVFDNGRPYTFKWFKDIHEKYKGSKLPEQRYADYTRELEEQNDLRKLRNEYMHWSAEYDWVGMDPTPDRVRVTY
ncbi:hypothetical protein ACJVDH_13045 [Pedobacter sp. AW1-32]|uniref:hypothetical protein n=1 Tax=Pedobacter sp. AW1-32 TaxID=3383026 RepID=UPI003FEEB8E2